MTNEGMELVAKCKQLRELDATECWRLGDNGLLRLVYEAKLEVAY